jgi:phage terminase large subunit GpA-like protein
MSKEGGAKWVAENPDATINGFQLPAFYSPLGFYSWNNSIDDWYRAQGDRDKLKTFVNTILGETWEDSNNSIEFGTLMDRREVYDHPVPKAGILLTCAVDVQPDRFELEVTAWGNQYTKYGVEYRTIWGDTTKQHGVWDELDGYLASGHLHASGQEMYIMCTTIDSGDGGSTDRVYEFCVDKSHRHIFAIKGGSAGNNAPLISKPTKNRAGGWLYVLGVDALKDNVFHSLNVELGSEGYWHFPMAYTEEYFKMLASEKKIYAFKNGVKSYKWRKIRERNEALDIACYNRAALEILQPNWAVLNGTVITQNLHLVRTVKRTSSEVNIYEKQEMR